LKGLRIQDGKSYAVLRQIPIQKFETGINLLNMNYVKAYRDWLGADHVLRDNTYFIFCTTIQDIEWEDIESSIKE
tara:strand:- start:791 stop:1015 length:225 start_codon:yes stop_codon:yes gene_type:complete